MNKIKYIATLLFAGGLLSAQVTIGKTTAVGSETAPATANTSVSLELGNPAGTKGIILPWVTKAADMTTAVVGTLVFDTTTQKVKLATTSTPATATTATTAQTAWMDLSNGATTPATAFVADTNTESANARTTIGTTTDTSPGILVLTDTNKAMILPRVNKYTDIVNPSAGMMVFVNGDGSTNKQVLAVFNGSQWSFWAP